MDPSNNTVNNQLNDNNIHKTTLELGTPIEKPIKIKETDIIEDTYVDERPDSHRPVHLDVFCKINLFGKEWVTTKCECILFSMIGMLIVFTFVIIIILVNMNHPHEFGVGHEHEHAGDVPEHSHDPLKIDNHHNT